MSAAAAVIPFPVQPEWYKVEVADEKRFGRGVLCRLVTVLKYRARLYGPSFETDYAELMAWTGYRRTSIAEGLAKLASEKYQFVAVRSSGRGIRLTLPDAENTKVGLQKSGNRTTPIDGNARARQASRPEEEKNLPRSEEQAKTQKPEESGQRQELTKQPNTEKPEESGHRPRQKPVVDPAIDQADKANPVQAAKKIGLYKPERFTIPALRAALWHYRRRVARINAAGLLYVILRSIQGSMKPEAAAVATNDYAALVEQVRQKQPPAAEQTSLFQSATESLQKVAGKDQVPSLDDKEFWERVMKR